MAEAETALELAKALLWGTYGPGAIEAHQDHGEPLPPLSYKALGDLDTDHLELIADHINPQTHGPNFDCLKICVQLVLEDRKG
jgi:hypothetical protein